MGAAFSSVESIDNVMSTIQNQISSSCSGTNAATQTVSCEIVLNNCPDANLTCYNSDAQVVACDVNALASAVSDVVAQAYSMNQAPSAFFAPLISDTSTLAEANTTTAIQQFIDTQCNNTQSATQTLSTTLYCTNSKNPYGQFFNSLSQQSRCHLTAASNIASKAQASAQAKVDSDTTIVIVIIVIVVVVILAIALGIYFANKRKAALSSGVYTSSAGAPASAPASAGAAGAGTTPGKPGIATAVPAVPAVPAAVATSAEPRAVGNFTRGYESSAGSGIAAAAQKAAAVATPVELGGLHRRHGRRHRYHF